MADAVKDCAYGLEAQAMNEAAQKRTARVLKRFEVLYRGVVSQDRVNEKYGNKKRVLDTAESTELSIDLTTENNVQVEEKEQVAPSYKRRKKDCVHNWEVVDSANGKRKTCQSCGQVREEEEI